MQQSLLGRNLSHIVLLFIFLYSFSAKAQKEVTILYTNDIESVYQKTEAFWNDDIEQIGGLPYLSTLIKETQAKEKTSFLFDAGDIFTGALSAATEGALPFDVYNSMGYDAISLGNHEFEYGWERFIHVKQRAQFPVLCCNIFYEDTDITVCQSYTILEKDGIRIGLVGLMGIEAFTNTMNPAHRIGLEARDPYPITQKLIDEMRPEVDLIVLLTHQNLSAPMQTDKEADPYVQRGFDEDYEMAGRLKDVDLIIGGHSDNGLWEPVIHPETGTIICMTFGQGKYLGYLNLKLEKEHISINKSELIPVKSAKLKADEKIMELVEQVRKENQELIEVLGTIDKPAFRKYYKESSLGNILAEMNKNISKADIGLVNSGAIRADLNTGEITTEEVINIYPFVDKYHVVEIDGKALKELLEYSYQLTYGFAQLSGIKTKFDSNLPKGQRLIEATVNGELIDDKGKYTIASSSFLSNGGDGFSMLKEGKLISISEKNLIDEYIDYIREHPQVPYPISGNQLDLAGE